MIHSVDLTLKLTEEITEVKSLLKISKNQPHNFPLILQGRNLELISLKLNGEKASYQINNEELMIENVPNEFTLETVVHIKPQLNTSLEGLYKVKNLFCSQCEAEGFRKITYYLDRPDVMSIFTTTLIADKTKYPVLLSNGNLIDQKDLGNNLHQVTWNDPFKKPCYLYAIVAGDLACIEDHFITQSGRKVAIKLYVDHGDEDKTAHAMASIKKAMRWDEEVYGREYDLDIFMVVATHDFNMGAMENKGLNIFNSKYILAKPETATDEDYIAIERVIGHEYFHNWTGNRITCRDWFQLSLKEGLTVFRDASFSADMTSPAVVRINDVNTLRSVQFPQDASSMAHPVRPDSYMEINNFYTVTIYEKGAEVIHMLYTLLGKEGFRKGMDLYFERHDGQAVRIEEFVQAHSDANHKDLTQFMEWYDRKGTPELFIETTYDVDKKQYKINIKQSGFPFHLPFSMGLINKDGKDIVAKKLEIKNTEEAFTFDYISEKPVPSFLRGFSAPVKINYSYTDEELAFLLSHDSDAVSRWDAGQQLAIRLIANSQKNDLLVNAWKAILEDNSLDNAYAALLLLLPNEHYLIESLPEVSLDDIFSARKSLRNQLTQTLEKLFLNRYQRAEDNIPGRALKNRCLQYLSLAHAKLMLDQLMQAKNMTDEIGALSALSHQATPERENALAHFYQKWQHETLVLDKWFSIQARSELPDVLSHVKNLLNHPAFEIKNPNKVRALIGAFAQNLPALHAIDGSGYQFLTEQIIKLNKINPIVAARLCEPFTRWKKYDEKRQQLIKNCLTELNNLPGLAKDVFEVVAKSLQV